MPPEIRRLAAGLPSAPGVYRFRDARGRVLHVGRATELRARVGSYGGDLRHRAALAEAVAAVLRRDPVAVATARQDLERVRDRASAALAFELAGRVQEELRALDWVTSAQQVTTRSWPPPWLGSPGEHHLPVAGRR